MAYWMAYKNQNGKYRNYKCSCCCTVAPQDYKKRSIITDICPKCKSQMSYIGLIEGVDFIKK